MNLLLIGLRRSPVPLELRLLFRREKEKCGSEYSDATYPIGNAARFIG